MTDHCEWAQDECGGWETACGNLFDLNEGTPADNNMVYCPFSWEEESE